MDVVSLTTLAAEQIAAAHTSSAGRSARHDLAAIEDSVVLMTVISANRG